LILNSVESRTKEVLSYYATLLGRSSPPSAPESTGWVSSPLDMMDIRIAFESSQEFFDRV